MPRVDALRPAAAASASVGTVTATTRSPCVGHHERATAAGSAASEPGDREAIAVEGAGRGPAVDGGQEHGGVVVDLEPERVRSGRGPRAPDGGAGLALELEQQRHRRPPVDRRARRPAQLGQGGVELGSGAALGRMAQAACSNSSSSLGVHQRSLPRSSRRRAMMLRWISAVPP